ncbi:FkbM family methyltransferase [Phormidium sp. LEGE 05292]|uniref:FkbM family methyltransferase n=1 Tax=[Phormidium] sp. LEGE 05292 TaxID=767427 RepID=UPI00187EFB8A|nr:FkbM family methyltransferase [Phormidium sp. LEGE 05292]MBE9227148.1 FkbM family methyltransferase [Phormidium sp. LEGE 05292]
MMSKEYQIGRYHIILPSDHLLDSYQSTWLRYDTALGYIAQAIFQKYPESSAIDIGANVGDSAALIKQYSDIPVLCIEGNPNFLEYLKQNAFRIGGVEIAECFVGKDGELVNLDRLFSSGGTASIVQAIDREGTTVVPTKSLELILSDYPIFKNAKLLKIDTDGFDFYIIETSLEAIEGLAPVIYFEYDISFQNQGEEAGLATIQNLFDIGYEYFMVYDNYGNYLISLSHQEYDRFLDLTSYLASNRKKSGTPVVHYFDICAFTENDIDLFESIRLGEINLNF